VNGHNSPIKTPKKKKVTKKRSKRTNSTTSSTPLSQSGNQNENEIGEKFSPKKRDSRGKDKSDRLKDSNPKSRKECNTPSRSSNPSTSHIVHATHSSSAVCITNTKHAKHTPNVRLFSTDLKIENFNTNSPSHIPHISPPSITTTTATSQSVPTSPDNDENSPIESKRLRRKRSSPHSHTKVTSPKSQRRSKGSIHQDNSPQLFTTPKRVVSNESVYSHPNEIEDFKLTLSQSGSFSSVHSLSVPIATSMSLLSSSLHSTITLHENELAEEKIELHRYVFCFFL
jgi:hypothetical protein